MDEFVLDESDNPHPKMLAGALRARGQVMGPETAAFWDGYLRAMADATGCEPRELELWLDGFE